MTLTVQVLKQKHFVGQLPFNRMRAASVAFVGLGLTVRGFGLDDLAFGTLCPLLRITGVPCPLCGGTRAMAALFRGQIGLSVRSNPLVAALAVAFLLSWFNPGLIKKASGSLRARIGGRRSIGLSSTVLLIAVLWVWQLLGHVERLA